MLRQFFLFGFVLISLPGISQFTKGYSGQLNHSWFNCDEKKHIYAVSEGRFLKISPPYNKNLVYDLENVGTPSFIDINNSNQIVLYFQNTHKVILLDSMLNELIRPFYLDELGIYDISMIFASQDGGLWFYNNFNNTLTKLNKNFLPIIRSLNLNPYFQLPNCPSYVAIFQDKLYLNVPSNGILVIGQNGEYRTAFQLPGIIDFQIDEKALYFYRDYVIYCYNYKTLKIKKVYIPHEPDVLNAWFFKNQVLIVNRFGFTFYSHDINPIENN
jgi:hypothetical protein